MKRTRKTRKTVFLLIAVMMISLLGGCARKFDAAGYTQAVLDVSFKNETAQYIKMTGASKDAAEKIFSKNIDAVMGVEALKLPKDLQNKFRKLFENLVKDVKYTVGKAVEDKNKNFTVDVKIEPILLADSFTEFQKQTKDYANKVSNDVMNGAAAPTQEEMQNHVYELYYNILKKAVDDGIKYGKPETVTVNVNKTKGKIYEIMQSDMNTVTTKLISQK